MKIKFTQTQLQQLLAMGTSLDFTEKHFKNHEEMLVFANSLNIKTQPRTFEQDEELKLIQKSMIRQFVTDEVKIRMTELIKQYSLPNSSKPMYVAFIDPFAWEELKSRNKEYSIEVINVQNSRVEITSLEAENSICVIVENTFGF